MKTLKGKRVFLYARVSTTEQKENGYRLKEQKKPYMLLLKKMKWRL